MIFSPVSLISIASYLLMLLAWRMPRARRWHISVMACCMVYDVCVPFYLFFARNWPHRLIDEGGIFNFLIWMHVMLDIVLFTLYFLQIRAGLDLWRGDHSVRLAHQQQGSVILVVRALVIVSGAMLAPN